MLWVLEGNQITAIGFDKGDIAANRGKFHYISSGGSVEVQLSHLQLLNTKDKEVKITVTVIPG